MSRANTYEQIKNLINIELLNERITKSLKLSKLLFIITSVIIFVVVLIGITMGVVKHPNDVLFYFIIMFFGALGFILHLFTYYFFFKVNIRRIEEQINQTFVMSILEIILKDFKKFQILKNSSDWEHGLIFLTDGNIVVENKLNTTDLFDANIWKARKFNNQKMNQITFLRETILNIFMRDFYDNIEKSIREK